MWLNGLDPFFGKISDLNVAFDWRLVHLSIFAVETPPPKKTDRPVKLAPRQARKLSEIERSSEWVESATLSRVVSNTDKKVLQYQ